MFISKKAFFTIWAVLAMILVGGCDSSDTQQDSDPEEPVWDYADKGPARWANIASEWAICGSGMRQSPIDISVTTEVDIGAWAFKYGSSKMRAQNDSKTIHLFVDTGSSIAVNEKTFILKEIHFHTTSEHTFNGVVSPGEIHFVHESSDGEVAYVAALVQVGNENKAIATILSELPAEPGDPIEVDLFFNAFDFLPESKTFYRYDGSLTTPACTEGVTWIVLQNQLIMSSTQINGLRGIMGLNFRPVQPLNGRTISQN